MYKMPAAIKNDSVVNAAVTVANYIQQFEIASMLETLCRDNPNNGKPGAGRFDMKAISIEEALKDEKFAEAVGILEANSSQPDVQRILSALYRIAPQAQQTYS